jgi:ubiquinone/menaquinone biosynthesis C-methylase UbiE
MKSLYDFPQLYDLVLERPGSVVETEVQSLVHLFAEHNIAGGKVLELACGACAHGILLAKAGFQVVGIDRSAAMLAEAQCRAKAEDVNICTVEGDVIDFDLAKADFDAAIFMYETFPLITEQRDIVSHFCAVHRHLKRGGVYVVDVDVPRPSARTTGEWGRRTLSLPDGYVETWCEDFPDHLTLHCRICLGDQVHETRDDWHVRVYSPRELYLLVQTLEGWQLDGFYSWRDLSVDISNVNHYFIVFVAS